MGKKGTERRAYTKELKAEAAALAGKKEKPDRGRSGNRREHAAPMDAGFSGVRRAAACKRSPGTGGQRMRGLPACGKRTSC